MPTILIALGANLGDRGETITQALEALAADPQLSLIARSQLLVTAPVGGPPDQPDFLNAAASFETDLSPTEVHQRLIDIEQQHGRVRSQRWGARSLDLDLLLYDEQIIASQRLTIPHPRMTFRRFVMQPAAEVAPQMRHPQRRATLAQLWQHLNSAQPVVEIATLPGPAVAKVFQQVQALLPNLAIAIPQVGAWPATPAELREWLGQQNRSVSLEADQHEAVVRLCWWHGLPGVLDSSPQGAAPATAPPRVVVHWHRPDETFRSVENAWWSGSQREALQQRLAAEVDGQTHSPFLSLPAHDPASAAIEIAAAIQAM